MIDNAYEDEDQTHWQQLLTQQEHEEYTADEAYDYSREEE